MDYLQASLEQQGTLEYCIKQLVSSGGTVSSPLPEGADLELVKKRFDGGGLFQAKDTRTWLDNHLASISKSGRQFQVILFDVWLKQSDLKGLQCGGKILFHDEKVYYVFNGSDISKQSISVGPMARCVSSFLLIGLIIVPPVVPDALPPGQVVGNELIEQIVQHTQEVYVSAYDQEGIVIWQK